MRRHCPRRQLLQSLRAHQPVANLGAGARRWPNGIVLVPYEARLTAAAAQDARPATDSSALSPPAHTVPYQQPCSCLGARVCGGAQRGERISLPCKELFLFLTANQVRRRERSWISLPSSLIISGSRREMGYPKSIQVWSHQLLRWARQAV